MQLLDSYRKQHGDIFSVHVGGWQPNDETMNWVLLTRSMHTKPFFQGDLSVLSTSRANRVLFGDMLPQQGAFALEGDSLKKHKRIIAKPLNGERIKIYVDSIRDFVNETISAWPNEDGLSFNMLKEIHKITIATILKTIFGLELGSQFRELTSEISKLEDASVGVEEKMAIAGKLHEVIVAETERKKKEAGNPSNDIFSILLAAKDVDGDGTGLSDGEIHDELFTLLHAGFGSTSTMISWCFETILGHPEIYQKVRDELAAVLGEEKFTVDHLSKLPYLDACIKETFRIRPLFLVAGARRLNEDWELDGYTIPKDTMVASCSYLLHRHPDEWENAFTFDPERFLERDEQGNIKSVLRPDPFKWAPFGNGLRKCPGMAFALQETMVLLAEVLRNVKLELSYEVGESKPDSHDSLAKEPERHGFFMAPKGGPSVRVIS
jgi:unspecific monooxygenase